MSINAKELRIGNVIEYKNFPSEVFDIRKSKYDTHVRVKTSIYSSLRYANIIDCTQVILTPEILEKCGFEKRLHGNEWFVVCGKTSKNMSGLFIEINIDDNYSCSIGQLNHFSHQFGEYKHLHQLQNLYYALTGKELDISKFIYQQQNALKNGI